ncbi:MAG TPA: acyl carrier protein [Clostridium sp.]|nr:acyl carrier protein [Clostridia bacterium]HCW04312.1 acyl carrier protein [Clostridium sp.]
MKMLKIVKNTVQEFVDLDEVEITEKTHFVKELKLTSYDIVSIVGKLEEDLDIEIPDREISSLETVGDLLEYLSKKSA